MGYIYKITNTVSGKCYIGQTGMSNPEERWYSHRSSFRNGTGCPALRDAVLKYGIDNFKFEVLIICFDEARFEMEKLYIKKYNSKVPNGYNILEGGIDDYGFHNSKYILESSEYNNTKPKRVKIIKPDWFKDLQNNIKEPEKTNKENKNIIINTNKSNRGIKQHTLESKSKIKASVINYYKNGGEINKVNIIKHRNSMAEAIGRKVSKYDKEGKLLCIYPSITEAARQNNIKVSTLQYVVSKSGFIDGFYWSRSMPKETPTCHNVE